MKKLLHILVLSGLLLLCSCRIQQTIIPKHYNTLTQKAQITVQFDQHTYHTGSTIQLWRDEMIIMSVQPILGIELLRIEATPDGVILIDKFNRRYTNIEYNLFGSKILRIKPSFKLIQKLLTASINQSNKTKNQYTLTINKRDISIEWAFSRREYDTLTNPKRINLNKYKQVSLREILPL